MYIMTRMGRSEYLIRCCSASVCFILLPWRLTFCCCFLHAALEVGVFDTAAVGPGAPCTPPAAPGNSGLPVIKEKNAGVGSVAGGWQGPCHNTAVVCRAFGFGIG